MLIHSSHHADMHRVGVKIAILAGFLAALWWLPAPMALRGVAGYEPFHTLAETLAIVVGALIFTVLWSAPHSRVRGSMVLLAAAFAGVALLDFSHLLSFQGMPSYVTPSSPEKAINFWLAARLLAALALLAVALSWQSFDRGESGASVRLRYGVLAAVLALVALVHWLFLFHPEVVPRTFIPGQGLTSFKVNAEYLIIALNFVAIACLLWRMRRPLGFNAPALLGALAAMAMSEFFFTLYADVTDMFNLAGHIYKIVSYVFLYQTVFVLIISRPYSDLAEAEGLTRQLIESLPIPVYYKGTDGRILGLNAAWERFFGVPRHTMIGKLVHGLYPDNPDTAALMQTKDQELWNKPGKQTYEASITTADGQHHEVIYYKATFSRADGELGGLIGTIVDITERKRTEDANDMLEAQLRESHKMQAIGTLAGGIAHDFNNILAAILGNTRLAREDAAGNAPVQVSLTEIQKAAIRARDLVQQILSFSRRQPTERKVIALAPVVVEAEHFLRATLSRVALRVHCAADAPAVLADATQMQQVIINLVTNAMQAMRESTGHIDIGLDTVTLDAALLSAHPQLQAMYASHPGKAVRLTVSDNGPGMDADTLARIFEPFFTTKPVGEGTGLGLSVIHGIVQGHEGAIVVKSAPGKGTTFSIYLPVAAEAADALVSNDAGGAKAKVPAGGLDGVKHILFLDDEEGLAFLMKRLLERRGYRVSGFIKQSEALAALRADPAAFDLLLTDYNMPGMSGLDVAREVRAIRPDLPVAVTSGFIDEVLRAQAEGAGVREVIFKADEVEVFCDAVQRLAQKVQQKTA